MWLKYLLIGIMLFMLGGCRSTTSLDDAYWMAGDGYPDEYYEGYMKGCDSGGISARQGVTIAHLDKNAYSSNRSYKSGWDDGFNRCFKTTLKIETEREEYRRQRALDKIIDGK